jgi:hypothetical protein
MWSALTAHRRVGFFGGEQVSVSLSASACTDLAGNGNAAAGPFSRVYDAQGPAAVLTSSSSGYSNLAAISFTATFAETVTGTAEHRNGTTTHWGVALWRNEAVVGLHARVDSMHDASHSPTPCVQN